MLPNIPVKALPSVAGTSRKRANIPVKAVPACGLHW